MRKAGSGRSAVVTGISPNEGAPGTRVTIRGEHLGFDASDLIALFICSQDCTLSAEWKSSSKIIARTGAGRGTGDIVIVTKSGGKGSSNVTYKGIAVQVGLLVESAIWVDESALPGRSGSTPGLPVQPQDPLAISDEDGGPTLSVEELNELLPGCGGDMTAQNFSPIWYLLENHAGTGFDDLKAGLSYMKSQQTEKTDKPVSFAKLNLTGIIACRQALLELDDQVKQDERFDGASTSQLVEILTQSNDAAQELFNGVLHRKSVADRTRSALSVLHRFRFLFQLPGAMDRNIKKGDIDVVISDYNKAKQLFAGTDVQLFKSVYSKVEGRIAELRENLTARLLQLPANVEDQKKTIKYLLSLGATLDPLWNCIANEHRWIVRLMNEAKEEWQSKSEAAREEGKANVTPSRLTPSSRGLSALAGVSSTSAPPRVAFVDSLCSLLGNTLPDLCALAKVYFAELTNREGDDKSSRNKESDQESFKEMLREVGSLYCEHVRSAMLPAIDNPEDNPLAGLTPWLPHCLHKIRSCVRGVQDLGSVGEESITELRTLVLDVRSACLLQLINAALDDASYLDTCETWVMRLDDEYGGITELPAMFESLVTELIQVLNEVVLKGRPGEIELWSQEGVSKEATNLCVELLKAFHMPLQILAFRGHSQAPAASIGQVLALDPSIHVPDETLPPLDVRLLAMLSDCNYVVERVLPGLISTFSQHGFPGLDVSLEVCQSAYRELDGKLFEAYVEEKFGPVVGVIEQSLYAGAFTWDTPLITPHVRGYIKRIVLDVIAIHAEVSAASRPFVGRVIRQLVGAVCQELSRLLGCVAKLSSGGALQARLDLGALSAALHSYLTPSSRELLDLALKNVPPLSSEHEKLKDEVLEQFSSQFRLQTTCFE